MAGASSDALSDPPDERRARSSLSVRTRSSSRCWRTCRSKASPLTRRSSTRRSTASTCRPTASTRRSTASICRLVASTWPSARSGRSLSPASVPASASRRSRLPFRSRSSRSRSWSMSALASAFALATESSYSASSRKAPARCASASRARSAMWSSCRSRSSNSRRTRSIDRTRARWKSAWAVTASREIAARPARTPSWSLARISGPDRSGSLMFDPGFMSVPTPAIPAARRSSSPGPAELGQRVVRVLIGVRARSGHGRRQPAAADPCVRPKSRQVLSVQLTGRYRRRPENESARRPS